MADYDYLTTDEIIAIHPAIVAEHDATESGVRNRDTITSAITYIRDAITSAITYIRDGYFGQKPETLPEKAAHLMRLLTAAHPFVDGNKRTALNATETFLARNGVTFDYNDEEIRHLLRQMATNEDAVETRTVTVYIREHTHPTEE